MHSAIAGVKAFAERFGPHTGKRLATFKPCDQLSVEDTFQVNGFEKRFKIKHKKLPPNFVKKKKMTRCRVTLRLPKRDHFNVTMKSICNCFIVVQRGCFNLSNLCTYLWLTIERTLQRVGRTLSCAV